MTTSVTAEKAQSWVQIQPMLNGRKGSPGLS